VAPCGHPGEHVIGNYVACPVCDRGAVPKYVEPEKTECEHDWSSVRVLLPHVLWRCTRCGLESWN
jgi:hypothetical protein